MATGTMTSALDAVILTLLVLLPGAFAAWGFERNVPRYSHRSRDWVIRLAGASALCLCAGSWPFYWMYANYWDQLSAGKAVPRFLYLVPFAYLSLPFCIGWLVGIVVNRRSGGLNRLLASNRAPTAWDHVFSMQQPAVVRCRLRSGAWVGGLFSSSSASNAGMGRASYASNAVDDQDIFIAFAIEFDQRTGETLVLGDDYAWTGGGVLIKWSDVESLELIPYESSEEASDAAAI
ncbi:DUF6338 family protein [Candidatus Poriferisodalis sp.]|uniref:DUF6338 family protein n=1 Tax=Candidatus Poriferisodalis sp. TaxID=3101277 RepID=UPI003B5BA2A0